MCVVRAGVTHDGCVLLHRGEQTNLIDSLLALLLLHHGAGRRRGNEGREMEGRGFSEGKGEGEGEEMNIFPSSAGDTK